MLTTLRRKSWENKLSQVSLTTTPDDNPARLLMFLATLTEQHPESAKLDLGGPQAYMSLENIEWNVVVPKGIELTDDDDGNLELLRQASELLTTKSTRLLVELVLQVLPPGLALSN